MKWWINKCDNYRKQDKKYNQTNQYQRDLTKCVSEKDFEAFMKMYNSNEHR